jgi:hypothetical protein
MNDEGGKMKINKIYLKMRRRQNFCEKSKHMSDQNVN